MTPPPKEATPPPPKEPTPPPPRDPTPPIVTIRYTFLILNTVLDNNYNLKKQTNVFFEATM